MWYIIARGADAFRKSAGRLPGSQEGEYTADVQPLKEATLQVAKDLGLEDAVMAWDAKEGGSLDELVTEYCRFGGSEPHNLGHHGRHCVAGGSQGGDGAVCSTG